MIRIGNGERTIYGPPNFYNWSEKAKVHYILKRCPKATGTCNGVPWSMGGSHSVHFDIRHPLVRRLKGIPPLAKKAA